MKRSLVRPFLRRCIGAQLLSEASAVTSGPRLSAAPRATRTALGFSPMGRWQGSWRWQERGWRFFPPSSGLPLPGSDVSALITPRYGLPASAVKGLQLGFAVRAGSDPAGSAGQRLDIGEPLFNACRPASRGLQVAAKIKIGSRFTEKTAGSK